ncbi:MAG: hypothetical protein JSW27_23620 [Phycisphaerales bacterium]|nr:MAG: hypothetical protein JSW27_23620 [Phycisphaerales bacterium]
MANDEEQAQASGGDNHEECTQAVESAVAKTSEDDASQKTADNPEDPGGSTEA